MRSVVTIRRAVSVSDAPDDAASTAIPYAGSGAAGKLDRYAEDVGAELVPVAAADGAAGERDGSDRVGAEAGQVLERESLDEGHALEDRGVRCRSPAGLPRVNRSACGRDEREALTGLGERVDDGVDGPSSRRLVEGVEVRAGEQLGQYAGAGARCAAGEPAAVGWRWL